MTDGVSYMGTFKSRYTDREVGPAQYLSEILCERLATKEKRSLPWQFWNHDEWKKPFKKQLLLSNSLLKLYSVEVIISVLRRNKTVYSLGAKWIDDQLQREQKDFDRKQNKQRSVVSSVTEPILEETPSESLGKSSDSSRGAFSANKSLKSKLEEI